tara:strand:- start:955 stop:1239 length:285 start_codon:yes stop_codon:yes gene_type:complete
MPTVNVTISNASTSDQRTAAFILEQYNLKQTEKGEPLFTNISEIVEFDVETRLFPRWGRMEADARIEQENLLTKFWNADEATRDQIVALLPNLD